MLTSLVTWSDTHINKGSRITMLQLTFKVPLISLVLNCIVQFLISIDLENCELVSKTEKRIQE